MDKSALAKSKPRLILNEIKFRLGFASGMVLILLVLVGVFWMLVKW
jgi:hypothetical protein